MGYDIALILNILGWIYLGFYLRGIKKEINRTQMVLRRIEYQTNRDICRYQQQKEPQKVPALLTFKKDGTSNIEYINQY